MKIGEFYGVFHNYTIKQSGVCLHGRLLVHFSTATLLGVPPSKIAFQHAQMLFSLPTKPLGSPRMKSGRQATRAGLLISWKFTE